LRKAQGRTDGFTDKRGDEFGTPRDRMDASVGEFDGPSVVATVINIASVLASKLQRRGDAKILRRKIRCDNTPYRLCRALVANCISTNAKTYVQKRTTR
jgi:hypothetical protein